MKDKNPILYILAGPNGIGKTTSFYDLVPQNIKFINADDLAKQFRESLGDINVQEIANGEATMQMNLLIAQRESFGFETNLADNETWKFIESIQLIGYKIVVNFFCVDSVQTCINRVLNRVKEGGHFVRPDIVQMRYENGLKLLKYYFELPDYLILTNNSDAPVEFLGVEKGNIVFQESNLALPLWVENILPTQTTDIKASESIEEIRKRYREDK
jgi:predicted ABC-type ATPase